jgi:5'-nucleotidase
VAQRQIDYDAHILGNHEFDFNPDFLKRFIEGFRTNGRLTQPFLSANLDFSGEPAWSGLLDADGLIVGSTTEGRVVARSLIHVDPATGQAFGVVGATTPSLPTISSPRNVKVTADLPATAKAVQTEIDRLRWSKGVRRIVLVSHLQDVANDRALIALLKGVDIAVAGGGDELLANRPAELLPGEAAPIVGAYPVNTPDADGRQVPIVTTAGNYKYLGRLDVRFNAAGEVAEIITASSGPKRVIPQTQTVPGILGTLGVTDAVPTNTGIQQTVITPVQDCLAALARPIIGTEVRLDTSRPSNRTVETNTGNSITDAYLASYDRYGPAAGLPARGPGNPVVAVQNGGGIRQNAGDSLPAGGAPGTLSRQNTLDVLAFLTNSMTVVRDVTPADLKAILERSGASLPGQGGQFLQIGGFTVTFNTTFAAQSPPASDGTVATPGERVRTVTLADGTKIVENGAVVPGAPNVALVTNSFTADGGDNYPWLRANAAKVNLPATYEQAWVEYLLGLPATTIGGTAFPTISASNPDYATGTPARRITIQTTP